MEAAIADALKSTIVAEPEDPLRFLAEHILKAAAPRGRRPTTRPTSIGIGRHGHRRCHRARRRRSGG